MKYLLLLSMLATDPITVTLFSTPCKMERVYYAEQVHISKEGILTMYFSGGDSFNIPLKYLQETQIQFGMFFRSYAWENGSVVERKTPICSGAV